MTNQIMRVVPDKVRADETHLFYQDTGCPAILNDSIFSVINKSGEKVLFETLEGAKEYTWED